MKSVLSLMWHCVCTLFLLSFVSTRGIAQSSPISPENYVQYPSLDPVAAISVNLADVPSKLSDAVTAALKANPLWDCTSPEYYKAAVVDKSTVVKRTLKVVAVRSEGVDASQARFTRCELGSSQKFSGDPGTVDLILDSPVNSSDQIQVFLYADVGQKTELYRSDGKLTFDSASSARRFTFGATPQAAPGESLINGTTRDVGQLSVNWAGTSLVNRSPINLYAKSTDLFSTDERDTKSAFGMTLGMQRGILPHWYFPLHSDETVQGNQTATNLSAVTELGVTTLLPWSGTIRSANNEAIRMPLSPDLSLAFQYTRRINQQVTAKTPALSANDISLNPGMAWSTIDFPFTCRLIFWQKPQKDTTSPVCLGTEIDAGLWYLPLDLTKSGSQEVKGYGDGSLLIPLENFSFASKMFSYVTSGDPPKYRVRVKYSDAVNAANNYARSKQWTYGIELIK